MASYHIAVSKSNFCVYWDALVYVAVVIIRHITIRWIVVVVVKKNILPCTNQLCAVEEVEDFWFVRNSWLLI
jgi:hypothetical protein